jgi:hypothetical protein
MTLISELNFELGQSQPVSRAQLPSLQQTFQHDEIIHPSQCMVHGHNFIDMMQNLSLTCVVIKCGMELSSL